MAGVPKVEVVVAHDDRATLRVGDVFVKIDADQSRADLEVEAPRIVSDAVDALLGVELQACG